MVAMVASPLPTLSSSGSPRLPSAALVGRDAAYLVAGLPAGVIAFSVLVTGLSLAAGLAVTLLGIPVLVATLLAARALGDVERQRAGWVLPDGAVRRGPSPARPRLAGGAWAWTKAWLADAGAWRDTAWGLLLMPIGTAGFVVATTLWSTALGLLTSPLWLWAVPENDDQHDTTLDFLNSHGFAAQSARVAAGLILIPITIATCRALSAATARAARAILSR
jgi:hypothetical protein